MKQRHPILFVLAVLFLLAVPFRLTAQSLAQERRQERLNRALITAVKRSDTKAALSLLDQGADANCHDTYKPFSWWKLLRVWLTSKHPEPSPIDTPLLLAIRWKMPTDLQLGTIQPRFAPENLTLVRALLDHGANVNARDQDAHTPLDYAIWGQKTLTIHLLLKYGADIKPNVESGVTPLVQATGVFLNGTDVITDMLQRGADVNQYDMNGDTALLKAVWVQNVEAVRVLLSYHADVMFRGMSGYTPLERAKSVKFGPPNQSIIDLLQKAGAKE